MNNPHATEPTANEPAAEVVAPQRPPRRRGRVGAIVGAGVIAGLFAVGATTFASAQTNSVPTTEPTQAELGDTGVVTGDPDDAVMSFELDECLEGVLEGHFDGDSAMIDEATMDAAFEQCGVPELGEGSSAVALSGPVDEAFEAELDAVFDRFDACVETAVPGGIDALESGDLDEDTIDAALESCEPILDELPGDVIIEDIDLDDVSLDEMPLDGDFMDDEFMDGEFVDGEFDAVFDRFDACVEAAVPGGIDALESGDLDEDTIDAAFESCEPILDELPGDVIVDDVLVDEFEFDCDPDSTEDEEDSDV